MNNKQKIDYLRQQLKSTIETYIQILNNRPEWPNRVRWLFDERNEIASLAHLLLNAEIISLAEYNDAIESTKKYA